MELNEQEEGLLDVACDDWIGLCEFREEFVLINVDGHGREIRGPTRATLRSLLSKGLIRLAYVTHHGLPVRMHGPLQVPDIREIPEEELDQVLADPASWQGSEIGEEAVEFTATPQGEEEFHQLLRRQS